MNTTERETTEHVRAEQKRFILATEKDLASFTPLENGKVRVWRNGPAEYSIKVVSASKARAIYRALLREGYVTW